MRAIALLILALACLPAAAQFTPPLGSAPAVGGPRTPMLTLASPHLSGQPAWSKAWLEPVIDRLVDWRPGLVTVEQLSGAQCEAMQANPAIFGGTFDTYCRDATPFQRSLGMTRVQAATEAERQLAQWPAAPTPIQRRRLAMLFMAAGEPYSAMVQWLRLPEAERRAGDGLTERAVEVLRRPTGRMNETYDIAAEVAARTGLERVFAVDDHTSDAVFVDLDPGYGPWQQARFATLRASPLTDRRKASEAAVRDAETMLAYYRAINALGGVDEQIEADFGGAVADGHPARYGRQYAAWWETRNLRMVANIREATARRPGVRVLNVVGSSHKPWHDQWARQFADVEVVEAIDVLR